MKKFLTLLLAGALTLSSTATAFAKSTDPDYPRPLTRMAITDPDYPRPQTFMLKD